MGILTNPDKEKIKRAIPKANNKIIDATVARLYIAHPDPTQWTYTGLVGAIALVDDLVGHTFFLKLVDILGHRGVIWDQELYVGFEYNQDRKFFHTFEIEDCLVGLLFEDTNDAAHFYKRVTSRQKHGSKQTVNNKNAIALKERVGPKEPQIGPRGEYMDVNTAQRSRRAKGVLYYDDVPPPEWRSLYAELAAAGITEDMIADNREFIKDYIAQQGGPLVGLEPPIPRKLQHHAETSQPSRASSTSTSKSKKAPPPPPPAAPPAGGASGTGTSSPASEIDTPSESHSPSPAASPEPTPAPASPAQPRFRVPPATAVAPPVHSTSLPSPTPQSPPQSRPVPGVPPGVPPGVHSVHGVPPPFGQAPQAAGTPFPPPRSNGPPPPPRANGPPPPPPRAVGGQPPPPPPPRNSTGPPPPPPRAATRANAPPPPPRAARNPQQPPTQPTYTPQAPPAPPLPSSQRPAMPPPPVRQPQPQPTQQSSTAPPPPPLPPTSTGPPPPPPLPPMGTGPATSSGPPPPPPLPPMGTGPAASSSGAPPPPPPPPPPMATGPPPPAGAAANESTGDPGRDALLASIRGAGIGALRTTDKSQLEKPSVLLQEAKGEPVAAPAPSGGDSGQPATLADALASALNKRKEKVAQSDDEDDDDW